MSNKLLRALALTMAFTAGVSAVAASPTAISAEGNHEPIAQEQPYRVANQNYTAEVTKYFNELNKVRKASGASELTIDPLLMKSAQDHANYLNKHGFTLATGHNQQQGKTGFTGVTDEDRFVAVGGDLKKYGGSLSEALATGNTVQSAFQNLLESTSHRKLLLSLGDDVMGVGIAGDTIVYVFANDKTIPSDRSATVKYPYDGQTNVDTAYNLENVSSSPLTQYGVSSSGYVISYSNIFSQYGTDYNIKLVDSKGNRVPTLNNPNQADGSGAEFYIIPKAELKQGEKYTATATWVDRDENPRTESWSFTTAGKQTTNPKPQPPTETKPTPPPTQGTSLSKYADYNPNKYWAGDFQWAVENKLIGGYANVKNPKTGKLENLLKPNTNLSETQMLSVLFRYFAKDELNATKPTTSWAHDINYKLAKKYSLPVKASNATAQSKALATKDISRGNFARMLASMHYNKPVSQADAIKFLRDNGITTAQSEKDFKSNDLLTRAHAVAFFHRYDQKIGN